MGAHTHTHTDMYTPVMLTCTSTCTHIITTCTDTPMCTHTSRHAHVPTCAQTQRLPQHPHKPICKSFMKNEAFPTSLLLPSLLIMPLQTRLGEERRRDRACSSLSLGLSAPALTWQAVPKLQFCLQKLLYLSRSAACPDPTPGHLVLLAGGTSLSEVQLHAAPLSQFQGRRATTSPPCHLQGEGHGSGGSGTTWRPSQSPLPPPPPPENPVPSVWWY